MGGAGNDRRWSCQFDTTAMGKITADRGSAQLKHTGLQLNLVYEERCET